MVAQLNHDDRLTKLDLPQKRDFDRGSGLEASYTRSPEEFCACDCALEKERRRACAPVSQASGTSNQTSAR